jgi:hypothetical protein
MRIWDDQAASPANILVQTGFVMDGSSTLLLVFEDANWGSLMQMGAGITVTLVSVPEPAVLPLAALGLALCGGWAIRRRRARRD